MPAAHARARGPERLELPAGAPKRRRRSRQVASAEIVAAAEEFLRERPFRELSVEEVMSRTSLSRSSFYVYFRDRHDLLLRVVEHIGDELYEMAERWYAGVTGDPREDARAGLAGVVDVYAKHGPAMRAIADAASNDPAVENVYQGLIGRFIDATAGQITADVGEGRTRALDPHDTAFALVWMVERYLNQTFGRPEPRVPRETAARTLHEIWVNTLYGEDA